MMQWPNFTKSLWFTITASIVVCFGILFVGFSVLMLYTGKEAFSNALTKVPFVLTDGTVFFKPVEQAPINEANTIPLNPLQRRFVSIFSQNVIVVALLGIATAIALGYILAQFFTEPLRKVAKGMRQLRKSTYKLTLEPTGTPEIDSMITEFNALTQKLQEGEQLRKNLISDTAHELNTPLTGLRTQLEAVQSGVLKLDKKRVATLLDQVDRLQSLTGALQEYAQLRGKEASLAIQLLPLHQFILKTTKNYRTELTSQGIKVVIKVPKSLRLKADAQLLERLISNLVLNTVRYAQADTITITADEHSLTFSDNGIGIPRKHWPYLFERFYRVDPSRSKKTGGLGLGLAIVKEIVDTHGWSISIKRPPGRKGISFRISL